VTGFFAIKKFPPKKFSVEVTPPHDSKFILTKCEHKSNGNNWLLSCKSDKKAAKFTNRAENAFVFGAR
jgi:hypothetical protein